MLLYNLCNKRIYFVVLPELETVRKNKNKSPTCLIKVSVPTYLYFYLKWYSGWTDASHISRIATIDKSILYTRIFPCVQKTFFFTPLTIIFIYYITTSHVYHDHLISAAKPCKNVQWSLSLKTFKNCVRRLEADTIKKMYIITHIVAF